MLIKVNGRQKEFSPGTNAMDILKELAPDAGKGAVAARLNGELVELMRPIQDSGELSPIGFEDDNEVLNACLRLAGRDDLCLKPEDYDDA